MSSTKSFVGKENQELDITINDELLLLTSTVMRSAVIPQYHLVLIGKPGVGRKTSIKIASSLLGKRIVHPASGAFPLFQNDLKLVGTCDKLIISNNVTLGNLGHSTSRFRVRGCVPSSGRLRFPNPSKHHPYQFTNECWRNPGLIHRYRDGVLS